MRFIVASYGARYAGLLLAHLHSIARSHPAARVAIYWQELPGGQIAALQAAFPTFEFHRTAFDFAADPLLRISSKVHCWSRAAEEHAGESRLCLADADTLVLRDLGPFFAKDETEVIFTTKPERTALNSGVLLARGGAAATAFFHEWRERTLRIFRDPELFRQANDYSLQYGGGDQLALWQILNYRREQLSYAVEIEGCNVRFRAEPCARLNETNSVPLNDDQHILHYKGGWQPILLQGRPFSKNRPRRDCWPMYLLYLRTFEEALATLNTRAGTRFTPRDFGIARPAFANLATGGFDRARYALHRLAEASRAAGRALGRLKQTDPMPC